MSLLGNQVYANPSTPLWQSVVGGGGGASASLNVLNILDTSGAVVGSYRAGVTGETPGVSGIQGQRIAFTKLGITPAFNPNPGNFASFIDISTGSVGGVQGGFDFWNVGGWLCSKRLVTYPTSPFAGSGTIASGSNSVTISNTYVTSNSIILLTSRGATPGTPTYNPADISGNAFIVRLKNDAGSNITASVATPFNWFVINNYADVPKPFF